MQRRNEPRRIVTLAARHHREDLAHYDMRQQLARALGCVARCHQALERLMRFWWRAIAKLRVDNLEHRCGKLWVRLGRQRVRRRRRALADWSASLRHSVCSFHMASQGLFPMPRYRMVHAGGQRCNDVTQYLCTGSNQARIIAGDMDMYRFAQLMRAKLAYMQPDRALPQAVLGAICFALNNRAGGRA